MEFVPGLRGICSESDLARSRDSASANRRTPEATGDPLPGGRETDADTNGGGIHSRAPAGCGGERQCRVWIANQAARGQLTFTRISGKRKLRRYLGLDDIKSRVEQIKGEPWSAFAQRKGDWGCALFLWGAWRYWGMTLRELGEAAGGIQCSAVHKLISRFEKCAERDADVCEAMTQLDRISNVEP